MWEDVGHAHRRADAHQIPLGEEHSREQVAGEQRHRRAIRLVGTEERHVSLDPARGNRLLRLALAPGPGLDYHPVRVAGERVHSLGTADGASRPRRPRDWTAAEGRLGWARVRVWPGGGHQSVANAWCDAQFLREIELLAQMVDVRLEHVWPRLVHIAPYVADQLQVGHKAARVPHQEVQNAKLEPCQLHRA